MRAVSIKLPSGKTVTLMPFDTVEVKRGAKVAEGERLGTLAGSGDISSSDAHLHMGLKKGRTYYDPMTLFGVSPSTAAASPAKERSASRQASPLSNPQLQAQPQVSANPVRKPSRDAKPNSRAQQETTPALEGANAPSAVTSSESAKKRSKAGSSESTWQPKTVSSGDVAWQPEVEPAPNPLGALGAALDPFTRACAYQASSLISGLQTLSQGTGIPQWALYIGALALGLALLTACIWAAVRWVVPFVGSLWNRAIEHWCSGNKRGKLLGLFPAPGSAFIPRGR